MRKDLWLAATAAIFLLPAIAFCQQQDAQPQQSSASQSQAQSQTNSQAPPAQPLEEAPLAAAARRAREQKKDSAKPAKVFDNDNIPTTGGVSTVGSSPATDGSGQAGGDSGAPAASGVSSSAKGEKYWHQRFADLHHKLESDQTNLDVMQRELSQLDIQYYDDPMKGLQQGLTRSDINDKTAKIDAMKKQIQADQQAIADAEDELRKSGGDPGWAH
jgi:cytoskeletal protein RodZ